MPWILRRINRWPDAKLNRKGQGNGLRRMIMSDISIDIGSVGTSAAPILDTTWLTSGKLSIRMVSIFVQNSTVSASEVPGLKMGCTT